MNASLSIPVATSQRSVPVKLMEENRRILNHHQTIRGKSKVSFTHLIAYAVVRALRANPNLNGAFIENENGPNRVVRPQINLGIAVDVAAKDVGERT